MKRIALVAALGAAFAAPAFAQSSVTVYGRLNTSIEAQKNLTPAGTDNDQWVLQNNASRIGFKGVEDLGSGLKADFFLEHRFNSDNGAVTQDVFWAGDSWVGLAGNFGWVRLGRITSDAYYATADYVSMHNHDTGTSADAFYDYGYFQSNGNNVANGNKITYTSPNFAGAVVAFQYGLKESTNRDDSYDLSLNYDVGNLHLGAGGTKFGDDWQVAFRGLYTMGALTFGGYYQYSELEEGCNDGFTFTGVSCAGTDGDRHNVRGAVMYTIGATELHGNVGWVGDRGDVNDSGAIQYTLGANYNLSKRTKLYAFYTAVDNEDNAAYLVPASRVGEKGQSFMVGIRHHF